MSVKDVVDEAKKSTQKPTQSTDFPVKILKENSEKSGKNICDFFNDCVDEEDFPSILKLVYVTPVFKKVYRASSKGNYQLESIHSVFFKNI